MIDDKQLQEWRKLADEATPEPWERAPYFLYPDSPIGERLHHKGAWIIREGSSMTCARFTTPDAAFIAAARTAVPALLDEVERLTVARAEMSLSLAGALRRIRELEGMLETERSTDDTDNGYEAGQESEI